MDSGVSSSSPEECEYKCEREKLEFRQIHKALKTQVQEIDLPRITDGLNAKHMNKLHSIYNFKACYTEQGLHLSPKLTKLHEAVAEGFANLLMKSIKKKFPEHYYLFGKPTSGRSRINCTTEGQDKFYKEPDQYIQINKQLYFPIEVTVNQSDEIVMRHLSWWYFYTNNTPGVLFCRIEPAPCPPGKTQATYNSNIRPFKLEICLSVKLDSICIFKFTTGDKNMPDIDFDWIFKLISKQDEQFWNWHSEQGNKFKVDRNEIKQFLELVKHGWMQSEHNRVLEAQLSADAKY